MPHESDIELYNGRRRILVDHLKEIGGDRFDPNVLKAIGKVPRHLFVDEGLENFAYNNTPVAIGHDQTISQPSTVALQTTLLNIKSGDRILEIGTGCGYQTAILYYLGCDVYSIERQEGLFHIAINNLKNAGFFVENDDIESPKDDIVEIKDNVENENENAKRCEADMKDGDSCVEVKDYEYFRLNNKTILKWGDGFEGWQEAAPFNGIIVTCAAPDIPENLLRQLDIGGKLVIPVGEGNEQDLMLISRIDYHNYSRKVVEKVKFVPMLKGLQSK